MIEDEFAAGRPAVRGRRRAVHRPRPRLGAVQAAHAQRRPLEHGVPFGARRHHLRPRGDGGPGRPHVPRGPPRSARPCPRSSRSPAIRREDYAASVLERFANGGVRDQIARLCIDGSAKFPTFLIPTIERAARARRPDRACGDGAGRLGALPRRRRSGRSRRSTPSGDAARRHAAEARSTTRWRSWSTRRCSRRRCATSARFRDGVRRRRTAGSPTDGPARRDGARRTHGEPTRARPRPRRALQHDRQQAIYMLALRQGSVDVADLARRYGVTTETIRRDLSDMQARHLLRRVHGGAVPIERINHEPLLDARDSERRGEAADRHEGGRGGAGARLGDHRLRLDRPAAGRRLPGRPRRARRHQLADDRAHAEPAGRRGSSPSSAAPCARTRSRWSTTRAARSSQHMAIDVAVHQLRRAVVPARPDHAVPRGAHDQAGDDRVARGAWSRWSTSPSSATRRCSASPQFDEIDVLVTDTRADPEAVDFLSRATASPSAVPDPGEPPAPAASSNASLAAAARAAADVVTAAYGRPRPVGRKSSPTDVVTQTDLRRRGPHQAAPARGDARGRGARRGGRRRRCRARACSG